MTINQAIVQAVIKQKPNYEEFLKKHPNAALLVVELERARSLCQAIGLVDVLTASPEWIQAEERYHNAKLKLRNFLKDVNDDRWLL